MINADRYLLISSQRSYFYDQKKNLENEIERLSQLYKKNYYKKKTLKVENDELCEKLLTTAKKFEIEISNFKNQVNFDFFVR